MPLSYSAIESTVNPSIRSDNLISVINPVSAQDTYIYQGFLFIPIREEAITEEEADISENIILYKDKPLKVNFTELPIKVIGLGNYYKPILFLCIVVFLSVSIFLICFAYEKKNNKKEDDSPF